MNIHVKGKKRHDTEFRKKFGIGLHQYQTILKEQDNKCYLCGNEDFRNLAVDHNHKTGAVRRLLCTSCNIGLGKFKEDPTLLRKAAEYLEQEFHLPEDVEIKPKGQDEKPRWRNIIKTPDGYFSSAEAASKFYNSHATTITRWCGAYEYFKDSKREGWESMRVYASLKDIKEEYNVEY